MHFKIFLGYSFVTLFELLEIDEIEINRNQDEWFEFYLERADFGWN